MAVPPLESFTKAILSEYVFPGADAAVVFVPEGQSPSPEVKAVLDRSHAAHWYPVAGGHRAKIPWHFARGLEALFEREPKGWDHEHCDFCHAQVRRGDKSWTGDSGRGGVWLFCTQCYEKLRDS